MDQGVCVRAFILVKLCGVWGNTPPVRNLPSAALTLHSLTKTELWWDSAVADCGAVIWEAVTKISIAALMRTLPCGSVPSPQDLTSFLLPLLHWSASLVGRCDVAIPFMAEHFRVWHTGIHNAWKCMPRTFTRSSETKTSSMDQGGFNDCLISGHSHLQS